MSISGWKRIEKMQAIRKNNFHNLSDKLFFESCSSDETQQCGEHFGKALPLNTVVAFQGELGAGKTTFIKGFARGAGGLQEREVNSPTFTYLNIYHGSKTIYHFDLYRLSSPEEFLSMGFDEYLTYGGICCIEWSERIASLLPERTLTVHISHLGDDKREIEIRPLRTL